MLYPGILIKFDITSLINLSKKADVGMPCRGRRFRVFTYSGKSSICEKEALALEANARICTRIPNVSARVRDREKEREREREREREFPGETKRR